MLKRLAATTLTTMAKYYPVLAITGPRQAGKTTLARYLFADKPYITLEDLDQRHFAETDPRGFLAQFSQGAILDEIQRCPQLFSYIQSIVDNKKNSGLFILTGSQQFGLLSNITQSLAGRVGLIQLLPFSLLELKNTKQHPKSVNELLFQGLYPPLYDRSVPPSNWYANYVMTYIERDARQLINVRDLHTFQLFVRMCAARTGQLLNLSSLANDCGITHNTAKAWISVLEASYILFLLHPHHSNFNKRLVKTPKLYFYDTGLACWLLGIQQAEQLAIHPMRGALFETWVTAELIKARFNKGQPSNLYFWRDSQGHEVDLLIESGEKLKPVEIKAGHTINSDYFNGLKYWQELAGKTSEAAWLIYAGDIQQERTQCHVIGWQQIDTLIKTI